MRDVCSMRLQDSHVMADTLLLKTLHFIRVIGRSFGYGVKSVYID